MENRLTVFNPCIYYFPGSVHCSSVKSPGRSNPFIQTVLNKRVCCKGNVCVFLSHANI